MTFKEFLNESNQGKGYASLTLTTATTKAIHSIMNELGLEGIKDLHITLVYDKSNPVIDMQLDKSKEYTAKIVGHEMLGEPNSKWYAFTLKLEAPAIEQRHREYVKSGFKHSYPTFIPHMSLMYQPSKLAIKTLTDNFDKFKQLKLVFSNEKNEVIKE